MEGWSFSYKGFTQVPHNKRKHFKEMDKTK